MGGMAENFIGLGIVFLGMNIYNLGLGMSATLVGLIIAVPRLIDVIIDPLIGNISDNARTRWGRRRPFILVGGIIAATFFVFQWSPPAGLDDQSLFFYFLGTTALCFFGYAIFVIPFHAMGLEMANDYNERTRIQSAKYLFLIVTQILCSWLYAGCFFFGNLAGPQEGIKTEVIGVRYVAWIVAALVILSCALPAIFCRERDRSGEAHEKIHFLSALKQTLSLRPFLILCGIFLATNVGLTLVAGVGNYVSIFHACGGDKQFGSRSGPTTGVFGIYLDEGSTGITVRDNLVHDVLHSCLTQHYGRDNVVENNIFALSLAASACMSRFPRCGGFIVWMGHDCFPCTANTSIVDLNGQPKPAAIALGKIFRQNQPTPKKHEHNDERTGSPEIFQITQHGARMVAAGGNLCSAGSCSNRIRASGHGAGERRSFF